MVNTGITPVRRPSLRTGVPPRRQRLWETRRSLVFDAALAALYGIPLAIDRVGDVTSGGDLYTVWHVVAALLTGVAILFRRSFPVTVLVLVSLLTTVLTWSLDANVDILAVPIALYAVAAYRSPRSAWVAAAASFVVAAGGLQLWAPLLPDAAAGDESWDQFNLLLVLAVSMIVAVLLGTAAWGRRQRLAALVDRAEQLARERDSQAQIATLAERSRIAREMHDIVAHSLSVMVALSDGAAVAAERDPAQARHALEQLSETGRTAMADMRRLLSVLAEEGEEPADLSPAPGAQDLSHLVDRFRTAGLPVRFTISGSCSDDAACDLTVYRIIQEALTNALRYSTDPTEVDVSLTNTPSATEITVTDDGRAVRPSESYAAEQDPSRSGSGHVGSGHGIIGMTERATMHGGHLEAGPLEPRGWRVHAVIPRVHVPS